jgi:hypothetical protein
MAIEAGDVVKIRSEWQDTGDDKCTFIAVENEDGGRVKIQAQLGLPINPTQVVNVQWLDAGKCN